MNILQFLHSIDKQQARGTDRQDCFQLRKNVVTGALAWHNLCCKNFYCTHAPEKSQRDCHQLKEYRYAAYPQSGVFMRAAKQEPVVKDFGNWPSGYAPHVENATPWVVQWIDDSSQKRPLPSQLVHLILSIYNRDRFSVAKSIKSYQMLQLSAICFRRSVWDSLWALQRQE